jgi:hypothetical protein
MDKMWKCVIQDEGETKRQDKNFETRDFEVTINIRKKIM